MHTLRVLALLERKKKSWLEMWGILGMDFIITYSVMICFFCETNYTSSKSSAQSASVLSLVRAAANLELSSEPCWPHRQMRGEWALVFSVTFNSTSVITSNIDSLLYLPSSITRMQFWSFVFSYGCEKEHWILDVSPSGFSS